MCHFSFDTGNYSVDVAPKEVARLSMLMPVSTVDFGLPEGFLPAVVAETPNDWAPTMPEGLQPSGCQIGSLLSRITVT
jgi:hypothetical protein